jgi:cobaltochelatase CobT
VRVVFKGARAYTDGKTIVVPEISVLAKPDMTEEEVAYARDFLIALRGHIYHEMGHVLHTEFALLAKALREVGEKFKELLNILEDPRIEKKTGAEYYGVREALEFMNRWLSKKLAPSIGKGVAEGRVSPFAQFGYGAILRANIENYEDDPTWLVLSEEAQARVLENEDLILAARDAETTREAYEHCKALWERLGEKDTPKPKPEEDKLGDSPEGAKGGDGDPGDGEAGAGDATGEEDPEGEAGSEGEEGDKRPLEGDEGEAPEELGEDTTGGPGEALGGEEGAEPGEEAGEGSEAPKDVFTGALKPEDLRGALMDAISEEVGGALRRLIHDYKASDRPYLVYTTEDDYIGPPEDAKRKRAEMKTWYAKLEEETRFANGPIARWVTRALQSYTSNLIRHGTEEGELDIANLYRLPMARLADHPQLRQEAGKVFYQTVQRRSLEGTAVAISIDCSGSMQTNETGSRTRSRLACQAVAAVAQPLERFKIPFEVTGWSSRYTEAAADRMEKASRSRSAEERAFARRGALLIYELKRFEQPWSRTKENLYFAHGYADNYDAESVQYAALRLLQRPERRKILFVFSDGDPAPGYGEDYDIMCRHLSDVIKNLRAMKNHDGSPVIEIVGFGLDTTAPERFYDPQFVHIPDLAALPGVVIEQLKRVLIGGKGRGL